MGKVFAIVVAAGQSRRMGEGVNKQLLLINGKPLLAYSLKVIDESNCINGFILVVNSQQVGKFDQLVKEQWGCRKLLKTVAGGEKRQDSVWRGLQALPVTTEIVVVHDGARPFICKEYLEEIVDQASIWGAAALAVPVKDTVKEVDPEGFVVRTLPREMIWLIQTPQAFSYPVLEKAHRRARSTQLTATDDAALVEAMGCRVKVVEGSYLNIKITVPEDLLLANALSFIY